MKWINIVFFILASLSAQAAKDERQLLRCLGQEEKKFHKRKDTGPLYDLNQRLISEMLQIPHAELNSQFFNEICGPSTPSPALKLLELSIRHGSELFSVPSNIGRSQRYVAKGMIDEYVEASKGIFIKFITQIQTLAPTASCLQEEISELESFFVDIKYLEEDVDLKKIFDGRENRIFNKLRKYRSAFKRCQSRIKKKAKSGSTEAAKKP